MEERERIEATWYDSELYVTAQNDVKAGGNRAVERTKRKENATLAKPAPKLAVGKKH